MNQTNVPVDLTNAIAVSAGGKQSLALRQDGTLTQWGETNAAIPGSAIDVAYIASGTNFHLVLLSNSTVVAWGGNDYGQTDVPPDLTNVVAIAAGGTHALALREDGHVIAWGNNGSGQTNVPADLTNAMAVAAGWNHSAALRNDGTVVCWGDNGAGQCNVSTNLGAMKLLAAGGNQTLGSLFSTLVQYPVDVSKDLLLIYNTNSADSLFVKDYYLAHRPMVSGANVLGLNCTTNPVIPNSDFTNQMLTPVLEWLTNNPTKRPQYMVLLLDVPPRLENMTGLGSVSNLLRQSMPGFRPFITHIHMGDTNDCRAYIDKLEHFGTNYSPGRLFISANAGG